MPCIIQAPAPGASQYRRSLQSPREGPGCCIGSGTIPEAAAPLSCLGFSSAGFPPIIVLNLFGFLLFRQGRTRLRPLLQSVPVHPLDRRLGSVSRGVVVVDVQLLSVAGDGCGFLSPERRLSWARASYFWRPLNNRRESSCRLFRLSDIRREILCLFLDSPKSLVRHHRLTSDFVASEGYLLEKSSIMNGVLFSIPVDDVFNLFFYKSLNFRVLLCPKCIVLTDDATFFTSLFDGLRLAEAKPQQTDLI